MATAKKNTGAYHTRSGPSPWVLGFEGREVPSALKGAIRAGQVGGLMLFRDNLGNSVEEARSIREEILAQVPSGAPFLFCADEEGGLVHPTAGIRGPQGQPWTAVPSPQALGRLNRAADARFVGSILGDRLRELGIHVDFAPLLDLDTQPENGVIGSRSFGSDPGRVAVLGWAFVRGLASSRIVGCFKHYPGHGGTSQDSHRVLPVMEPKHRALHEKPFVDCLRRPSSDPAWLMTAHVDWGDGLPASLSRAVISRVTRKAKEHLVVTDSLDMGAVSLKGGAGEQALLAHNDVLLVARDWRAGLHSITSLEEKLGHDPALLAAMVRARESDPRALDLDLASPPGERAFERGAREDRETAAASPPGHGANAGGSVHLAEGTLAVDRTHRPSAVHRFAGMAGNDRKAPAVRGGRLGSRDRDRLGELPPAGHR
ncbi:MAG: glycoside hydrolase family 3 N-terminal domain-containing protein [Candidatus Eisenbacteria bacterium]